MVCYSLHQIRIYADSRILLFNKFVNENVLHFAFGGKMLRTRALFSSSFEQLNPTLVFLLLQSYMSDIMPFIPNFGVDKYIIHVCPVLL
jgi:hypothetical protein